MCRITGFIDFEASIGYDLTSVVSSMRDTMAAGGPDDEGSYLGVVNAATIAFGHRRLSIIDTGKSGHQPMQTSAGNLSICYNGEIYNYREIRNSLITKGYRFESHSDTEVILHAYTEWGMACLNHFTGMFAFLLLDEHAQRLFAVRDRAGVKPLYYYRADDVFLFGSELKSFHPHPKFRKAVSKSALAQFLNFGYIPAPYAIFENCFKLQPGHYLDIDLKTGSFEDHTYWSAVDVYKTELQDLPLPHIIDETEKILTTACNYRMVADVPVGIFLSGGYDSTLVTALLQKDRTEKLKTFCIGFDEPDFNEAPFAKKVAAHLGTDHTEYICTHHDALNIIPELASIYDEPFGDSSSIPTILVSRIARETVKVALSADAGDEVFGGYEKYASVIRLAERLKKLPAGVRRAAAGTVHGLNPEKLFAASPGNTLSKRAGKFADILAAENMGGMLHALTMNYRPAQLKHILGEGAGIPLNNFNRARDFAAGADSINTMLAVDYITYLPDDILVKVDRATMSVGLEGREPLLDHHLLEWMARIPGKTKFRHNIKKYLLREIVHGHVPKEIMDRKKMGFGIPIALWFRKELREYFDNYFSDGKMDAHGLFNKKYVQQKKERFYAGDDNVIAELWYFLMFQLWYERWMS